MKKTTLCFVVILLFAITVFSQTGRKFTATAIYLSSINGNTGGEIKLKMNGKIQNFVWDSDEGTGKLPIFESNPKGFQQGAEWKITYSKYNSDDSYLFLWNATFTGRNLSDNNPQQNNKITLRTYLLLRVKNGSEDITADVVVNQTIEIIRKRLKMFGVPAYIVEREKNSTDLIVVKLPGIDDLELVKWMIHIEGRFEIVHLISPPSPTPYKIYSTYEEAIESLGGAIPSNRRILPDLGNEKFITTSTRWIIVESQAVIETKDLLKCQAISLSKQENDFQVSCSLKKTSEDKFYDWMGANINQYIAIVINGEVNLITWINSQVRGSPTINGKSSKKGAEAFAIVLMSGALPITYRLEYLEERLINELYQVESDSNANPQSVTTTGYIDVVETSGLGCRIRIIAGEKVYLGVITFDRLSSLTKRKINSCEDAVSILGGKKITIGLSGMTSSNGNVSDITFENITQITFPVIGKTKPPTQTWNEQTTNNETIINLSTDILFDFDKATIKPNAVPTLIRLARLIRQSKGIIQLNGFTDSKGTDEYNLDLSERRAASVKQWLVSKGGIDAERLQTKGYGESQPVAPNTKENGLDNPIGRQKNRRVEVRIPRN